MESKNMYTESVQTEKDRKQWINKGSDTWKMSHRNTEY